MKFSQPSSDIEGSIAIGTAERAGLAPATIRKVKTSVGSRAVSNRSSISMSSPHAEMVMRLDGNMLAWTVTSISNVGVGAGSRHEGVV